MSEAGLCEYGNSHIGGLCVYCERNALHRENVRLREENVGLRGVLSELRIRYHATGRRPEECYEMSMIDDALQRKEANDE